MSLPAATKTVFKAIRILPRLIHVLTLAFFSTFHAYAGGGGIDFDGVLGDIPDTICNLAEFLAGPVGFGVAAVIFVWGVVRWFAGQHGGMAMAIGGFVGGLILVAAPDIIGSFTDGGCF